MADDLQGALSQATLNTAVIDQIISKLATLRSAGDINAIATIRIQPEGVSKTIADLEAVSRAYANLTRQVELARTSAGLPNVAPSGGIIGVQGYRPRASDLPPSVRQFIPGAALDRTPEAVARKFASDQAYYSRVAAASTLKGSAGGYIPPEAASLKYFTNENAYLAALRGSDITGRGKPPGGGGTGGGEEDAGFGRFGKRFSGLLSYLGSAAILYPLASTLFSAAENATKLESTLTRIQGILGSHSLGDRLVIRNEIVDAATKFGIDIDQAAEAAQRFAQQGDSLAKIGTDLQTAAVGAQALGVSIERAQELMTSLSNITNGEVPGSSIFDRIMGVRRGSPVSADNLIQGIEQLLPLVQSLRGGYSGLVDDVDLVLGAVSTISKETNQSASTSLRFVLGRLGNPNTAAKVQELSGVGFGTIESGGKQLRPLVNILGDLAAAYQRLDKAHDPRALTLLSELAGSRQTRDVRILFSNWADAMATAERAAYSMGDATAAASNQINTTQSRITRIKTSLTGFAEGLLEDSAAGTVLAGTLGAVELALQGLSGGGFKAILTIGVIIASIKGITFAFNLLKTAVATGGIAETLGLTTSVVAAGELVGILLALGAAYQFVKQATYNPLAINFLTREDVTGEALQHLDALKALGTTLNNSPNVLYNTLTSSAASVAAHFTNATGAINLTRKAFVDGFIADVAAKTPQFQKYMDDLTKGLTPSASTEARLEEVQKIIGNIAYLSNAVGNAHYNQVITAEQTLGGSFLSNLSGLPKGVSRINPFESKGLPYSGENALFSNITSSFNQLDPATQAVSRNLLEVLHTSGALDSALTYLSSDVGKNADVWDTLNTSITNALTGPNRGVIIKQAADNLLNAFKADPKHFNNLLTFDDSSSSIERFAETMHNFLQKVFDNLNARLPQDRNSGLLKLLDKALRDDKGGVKTALASVHAELLKLDNPLAKFLEGMYLTLGAVDANARAAQALGDGFDYAGARLSALKDLTKEFYNLPLNTFKLYLDQLREVNQFQVQLTLAKRAGAGASILGQAVTSPGGTIVPPSAEGAQTADAAATNISSIQKQYDEARAKLRLYSAVINTLRGSALGKFKDTTLNAFRQSGIGENNPIYTDFEAFVAQFTTDRAALAKLKPSAAGFQEAVARAAVDVDQIAAVLGRADQDAQGAVISQQQRISRAKLVSDIGGIRIGAAKSLANALAESTKSSRRGDLGESINIIRLKGIADVAAAEATYENSLLDFQTRRLTMTQAEQDAAFTAILDTRTKALEEAKINTLKEQQLAIIQQISKVNQEYDTQVSQNLEARLGGLKNLLEGIDKLTNNKTAGQQLLGVGTSFAKAFQTRQVEGFLKLFEPGKGLFGSIGQLIGGAGERDPQLVAADYFATRVANAADYFVNAVTGGGGAAGGGLGGFNATFGATGALAATGALFGTPGSPRGFHPPSFGGSATQAANIAIGLAQKNLSEADKEKQRIAIGTLLGSDLGQLAGSHVNLGQRSVGPGASIGSAIGTAAATGLFTGAHAALALGAVGGPIGIALGGILGGLLGGGLDHPHASPVQVALERIQGNTKEQVTLLQNTNKLLELSGLSFNVASSFKLPRYGVDTFIGGGGSRGAVVAGTASVSNQISVAVSIGNTSATASDIGKMVAQAVSDRLESEYSTGGRYTSSRTRF